MRPWEATKRHAVPASFAYLIIRVILIGYLNYYCLLSALDKICKMNGNNSNATLFLPLICTHKELCLFYSLRNLNH